MPKYSRKTSLISLLLLLVLVVTGSVSIGASLALGIIYALIIGNQFQLQTHWYASYILQTSIVLLGFGLNIHEIVQTTKGSFAVTLLSIVTTLSAGYLLGRLFKVEKKLAFLVAGGTAICGGSAIAALAPAIQAKPHQVIVSISIVFLLNAAALVIYPYLGSYFELSQSEFGLWAALGIHDTSSVIGAAAIFGEEAMQIATTTKLARALWIFPLVIFAGIVFRNKEVRFKFPLFILLFVLASILTSVFSFNTTLISSSQLLAKTGMAVSLFLIGAGFTPETLRTINLSVFAQGVTLWLIASYFSFWLITLI